MGLPAQALRYSDASQRSPEQAPMGNHNELGVGPVELRDQGVDEGGC